MRITKYHEMNEEYTAQRIPYGMHSQQEKWKEMAITLKLEGVLCQRFLLYGCRIINERILEDAL